jgi:hypothetical protein
MTAIQGNSGEIHELARYAEANRIHGQSAAVRKFAGILYPNCLEPVEFTKYRQVDANAALLRV